MPTSVATHASLLLKAAAAKPFFSPRAAARIPPPSPLPPRTPPRAPAAARFPPAAAATVGAAVGVGRWFRWQSARGLCAAPHSGGEGMGSEAGVGARKRPVAAVNGLAKEVPTVNGVSKEDPAAAPPRLLTLPTVLTIGRVAAVPLLISTFYMDGSWAATATTGIFLAAAVTDWLDGYLARKMQLGTPFGAFLDPVADKLMVAATLVLLCTKPLEISLLRDGPWLLTVPSIAIIGREVATQPIYIATSQVTVKKLVHCIFCLGDQSWIWKFQHGVVASADDWENAAILCKCLEIFYEATKLLSGSYYPTANLFFSEFCEINLKLIEWNKSKNKFIVSMAKSIKEKFDKYWGVSNVALAVACFLDPRYKMKVVEFYYNEMSDDYGYNDMYEFKKIVQKLYDSYASKYASPETSPRQRTEPRTAGTSQCYVDLNEEPKRKRLSMFLRENAKEDRELSDYEKYCNEPLLSWKEGGYFDILSWWKTHAVRYPILARMARDVLAIPATTVASESAFSLGGRIVHKYCSRLDPQVVEALVCSKDWIRASREGQSGVSSIHDDLAGLSVNDDKVEHDEGARIDDGYNMMDLEEEDN